MKKLCCAALASAVLAMPAYLQGTTGVAGINDYTVAGMTPGSTSCTVVALPGGGLTAFTVSGTAPGLLYLLYASLATGGVPCCNPCTLSALPSTCLIPNTGCNPSTNQTIDIIPAGPCMLLAPVVGNLGAGGVGTTNINLPPAIVFATQAVIVDPVCKAGNFPVVFTQANDVQT